MMPRFQSEERPKAARFSPREQLMLLGLMVQSAITLMDIGMFNVALPSIQTEFGLPVDVLALIVAARDLPRLGLMPIYGAIGDRLGRKRMYMLGLVIFICGSVIGLFSQNLSWLLIARLIQGLGGASLPLSLALISDAFEPERRGRALGFWNAAAPAGAMLGPFLGGVLIEAFGWRAIFIIVIAGVVLAYLLVYRLVSATPTNKTEQSKFDWFGALSLTMTVTCLVLATTTSSLIPFGSALNYLAWALVGVGMLGLSRSMSRNQNPIFTFSVLKNRRFLLPSVAVSFRMFAHSGAGFLHVLYLTKVFGQSPSMVGTIVLFYGLALTIGVPLGGWLADRWISRRAGTFGMLIQAGGALWLGLVQPGDNYLLLAPGLIVGGLGTGLSLVSFTKEAVASLGEERVGLASGLYSMVRFTGTTIVAPLLGLLLAAQFRGHASAEFMPGPYQLGYRVLALAALCGAGFAFLIPLPEAAEAQTAAVPVEMHSQQ